MGSYLVRAPADRAFYKWNMNLRIRELRLARDMTQQELADAAGMVRPQLSMVESGKRTVNTIRLAAIAKALGVEVEDLFEDTGDAYRSVIIDLMRDMTEADRDALIAHARALAGVKRQG